MDFNKVLEQYGSMMGAVNNSNNNTSGGSGRPVSKFRRYRNILLIVIAVTVVMQLLHYRSVNKLMMRYSDVNYETTIVHPYNHCIEILSSQMVKSGTKLELDKIESVCKTLQRDGKTAKHNKVNI
ncbi:MAG: hypothetical protein JJW01_01910 [Alphaproteobacteria bacterium]|nr:hypothetical protein [Rickettsiales bacterium]